ncbi:MAG: phytoene desaturase family protein [Geitlerinemataceae cyanobacterium]
MTNATDTTEILIIGSGIGGLSAAALLAHYGHRVIVCESHSLPGGAAHSFQRNGYTFDSGPSLISGLGAASSNPLRHVLDAIGETVPCHTYNTWGCCLPEGDFNTTVGADQFCDVLDRLRGADAVRQWRELQVAMKPLAAAATAMPPAAVRLDPGVVLTAGRYAANFLPHLFDTAKLTGAFAPIADEVVFDRFVRDWLDLLCFLLSGLPASGTSAAEMAFMFDEWYKPGVVLEYPVGGVGAIVNALVRGLEKNGGELRLDAHVEEILLEGDRAVGVRLRGGEEIRVSKAVVSNASIWDTLRLFSEKSDSPKVVELRRDRGELPQCESFMHLHLGIDATGLEDLQCHYIFVDDWERGVAAEQNVVLISIPSVLDSSLAPPGKHAIHVYTPGNEPLRMWDGLDRRSEAYAKRKHERSQIMWKALARVIPDIRERVELELVGTPVTHGRFLRRDRGTYGPALEAGKQWFPAQNTPIPGLWCCGDSTFPGIGLPAVAASGTIVANSLTGVGQHLAMLDAIGV